MLKRFLLPIIAVVYSVILSAHADEAGWEWRSREIEPGHYYVAISEPTGPTSDPRRAVTLAERRPGSPPVSSMEDFFHNFGFCRCVANPEEFFGVRKGDIVHGRIIFQRPPEDFVVSSTGLVFAALGNRASSDETRRIPVDADAVVIVSRDGLVRIRKTLADLLSAGDLNAMKQRAEIEHRDVWSLWLQGAWLEETTNQLIVVCNSAKGTRAESTIRAIYLETGKVFTGSPDLALAAVEQMNRGALEPA